MNKAAQALGRLSKGKPKTMTNKAIAQRKRAGFKKGNKAAMKSNHGADLRGEKAVTKPPAFHA